MFFMKHYLGRRCQVSVAPILATVGNQVAGGTC